MFLTLRFKPNDPWAYEQHKPLDNMLFKDWWFHGYINEPPGTSLLLPLTFLTPS